MSLTVLHDIDELEVANAIKSGDLRLEHILQYCLTSQGVVTRLIADMEALGGTNEAGEYALMFAQAMKDA